MSAPTVLFYNLDTEKGRRIKLLCLPLKIRVRSVSPDEYGCTLSELLQGEAAKSETIVQPFTEEMLVMSGLANSQMNAFLQGFRRKKIPPVALKAVATTSNLQWNARQLRDELLKEHEAMRAGTIARPDTTLQK